MPWHGLVAWGRKRWARTRAHLTLVAVVGLLPTFGCDTGEGHKTAVECRTDADCDDTELAICETVSCVDNACEKGRKPDGHRCDDEDPLTGEDACLDGTCAGTEKTCADDLGPCLKAVHDPDTDSCSVEPVEDGVGCDDEDACTQLDTCQAGECVGSEPKTCEATDACHVAGTCDSATGDCSEPLNADDGTPCDDAQTCTSNDVCNDGVCTGEAVVCDDELACSADSCDEASGACVADMSNCSCVTDADCDDHNLCNGTETCGVGKLCQRGTPMVCPNSTDACLKNVCVAETGECVPEPVVDGTGCDDADTCTQRDTCQAGACVGKDAVVCAALGQCHTAGTCDPATGACSNPEKPKNSPCNDGNACTATDTCQAGQCVGGGQTSCAAIDQCHDAGVCDVATGSCSKPAKPNGVACSDGNLCTLGDACSNGACTPSGQVTCTASDSCHSVGTCDAKTGQCSNPAKPDGAVCSDGLTCTTPDTCKAGVCTGTQLECNDGVACTTDTCSEKLGGCTTDSSKCACATSADCNDNNPCNGVETCNLQTLQCQRGTPVDCSSLNDACNVGSCNALNGQCVASPKANGTTCDDGDKCTQASSCQAGVCQGQSPVLCAASDQCHDVGVCNPATGVCSNPVKTNGVACNDGNACTKTDTCQGGACTGASAVTCSASDQCHSAGTCNPATGVCTDPAKANGTACDDGSLCTKTDSCQGGICVGASPVTCAASDQCHSVGVCDPAKGTCTDPVKKDGSACNDGSLCTQTDTCQSGACVGANPITCAPSNQCHTAGVCDPAKGTCTDPVKKDGTACDDGSLCTQTDTCVGGTCTGGKPVTCTASDDCHDAGVCDPAKGTCSNPAKADGTLCNDGKTCTGTDKCSGGVCGGTSVACDDKIACTVDSCVEPTGCKYDTSKCGCAKDADCNDNNPCNGVETCNLGTLTCKNGTPVNCSGLDDACNTGTCDTQTGACKATPRTDGTSCNDADACTKLDACKAGKCVGSSPVTCTASDQCHNAGTCDPKTGVCSDPAKTDGATCNDGNACTQTDSCQGGTCKGASPVTCTASDQCHNVGTCDPKTGACTDPAKTDGATCNDGNGCTQTDTCQGGACKGANPVVCTAADDCHDVGVCVPKTGACTTPAKADGSLCDDANKCTQSDSCVTGVCTGSKPITCKAAGQCYKVGTCEPTTGVCSTPYQPSGTKCDDVDACTANEVCNGAGACGGGSTVTCQQPGNACLFASCNSTLGCVTNEQPPGTPCDDGSECSRTDTCGKGQCNGGNRRTNANGDWADDPGTATGSVDTFTDGKSNVHLVGTYSAALRFNDKDTKIYVPLSLSTSFVTGIYWTVYTEAGAVAAATNIGGAFIDVQTGAALGSVTVVDVAGYKDGSFTLLGMMRGQVRFGAAIKANPPVTVNFDVDTVYAARFRADGSIDWIAPLLSDGKSTYTGISIAGYDDGSMIAAGTVTAATSFFDVNLKPFTTVDRAGVWAARLDPGGNGKWASVVVTPGNGGNPAVANVTTHEDDGASLTGTFFGAAQLGPDGKVSVSSVGGSKDRDVWYQKLDGSGVLLWGGRVGGAGQDLPGDVARSRSGGALLLVNTVGASPNASDSKTTQQLFATVSSGSQTHVIGLDKGGVMQSDALIANPESGRTRGWQLHLDLNGFYAIAGTFEYSTAFYSSLGFGSGTPKVAPDIGISGQGQVTPTLLAARVDEASRFHWAVQAGGDGSGMGSVGDVLLAAHPTHSVTLVGLFNVSAIFGDKITEGLTASETGNPFVVHLNSEQEYDYCP